MSNNDKTDDGYRAYVQRVMVIQSEAVRRLVENETLPLQEMADFLEDVANNYLNLSDELRDLARGRPRPRAAE